MCIARGLHQITHPTSFHWLPTALVTIATGEEAGIFLKDKLQQFWVSWKRLECSSCRFIDNLSGCVSIWGHGAAEYMFTVLMEDCDKCRFMLLKSK